MPEEYTGDFSHNDDDTLPNGGRLHTHKRHMETIPTDTMLGYSRQSLTRSERATAARKLGEARAAARDLARAKKEAGMARLAAGLTTGIRLRDPLDAIPGPWDTKRAIKVVDGENPNWTPPCA